MASRGPRIQALDLPWLLQLIFLFSTFMISSCYSPPLRKIPRLSILQRPITFRNHSNSVAVRHRFRTYFYAQTLDHFSYEPASYTTFLQRYMVSSMHWRGALAAAPIFVYLGGEESLEESIGSIGFLTDNAQKFGALMVYLEHRYYGKSIPSRDNMQDIYNTTSLGYLNSGQALADYADIIQHLKMNLSAEASPVIVIGGSYGGMLAAWFRLKYPHIAMGALASSAPLLYFDDITPSDGFHSVVSDNFREASESCYNTIKKSWSEIDRMVLDQDNGLDMLTEKFRTCEPLEDGDELELKAYLENLYITASQYDDPPTYPVSQICNSIEEAAARGDDTIDRIASAVNNLTRPGENSGRCLELSSELRPSDDTVNGLNWLWQACTELLMPIGRETNETMFQAEPFDVDSYSRMCRQLYQGSRLRPNWITTYYGGHHIRMTLEKFASNIIFSNGRRDPFSAAGVLTNISPSVVAVTTSQGSHCLDILPARINDPRWLVLQRNIELGIIAGWIRNYYNDLRFYSTEK
ncbi:hypothetical protein ACLB2K_026472 [Fragaria x ananassa]